MALALGTMLASVSRALIMYGCSALQYSRGFNIGSHVLSQPVTDVTSNDVIWFVSIRRNHGERRTHPEHYSNAALVTPLPTQIVNVPAGAKVTTEWHHGGGKYYGP